MARHRNVRGMDLDEEYDGYYSCYGHSVEEDGCVSPSTREQFLYNRNNKGQTISSFMGVESPAEEENSSEDDINYSQGGGLSTNWQNLSPFDFAKLQSCIEGLQDVVGETIPESVLSTAASDNNFDLEKALDSVLNRDLDTKINTSEKNKVICEDRKSLDYANRNNNAISKGNKKTAFLPTANVQDGNRSAEQFSVHPQIVPDVSCSRADNVVQLYAKERNAEKPLLNLVVIGHVDAGKSTLMGHLLFRLGFVTKRAMHKYEQDSKKIGKASFMYAWVLDETSEERNRGITMDIAQSKFETEHRSVNLLDAPGHRDFIPNMITGAAQADVAILVIDATNGEFETGFEAGGQTREHTMLIRSLGVSQLAVAVNKMDNVRWDEKRYSEIVSKLALFLKQAGFRERDIQYVPCSGLTGENLTKPPEEPELKKWYQGPTLVDVIDTFKPPERPLMKPLRLSINDVFKGTGSTTCISGRLESGMVQIGDKVLVMPSCEQASVKGITIDGAISQHAFAGDSVTLQLVGVDLNNVTSGNILCHINRPVRVTNHFEARLVVFNVSVPITKGFTVVLHYQSLSEQAVITRLVSQLHRTTGELIRKHPRCLTKHTSAIVEIKVSRPICLELYKDFKDLGRFMLRSGGCTIAAGVVTEIF